MKTLSIILNLIILSSCHGNIKADVKTPALDTITPKLCNADYDSILIKYSNNFTATEIDLNKCLSKELSSFLLETDTICLEKQKEYKNFIANVLAKLYNHHLKCCNQGYDLLGMKNGAANIIIHYFQKTAGYNTANLEMLNSGTIVDFIDKEQSFKNNKTVQELRENIGKEVKRIEKGDF